VVCGLSVGASLLAMPATGLGAAVSRCRADHLHLSILDSEGAAGGRYWDLALRNVGHATCELHGYPGVGLLAKNGRLIATKVARVSGQPTPVVRLAPGRSGYFTFHFESSGPCIPHDFTVHGIEVYPPNDTGRLILKPGAFGVCDASVGGAPTVYPMRATKQLN
jgi:hypothetical protein